VREIPICFSKDVRRHQNLARITQSTLARAVESAEHSHYIRIQIARATLPKGRLSTRYFRASAASASGKVLATIGLMASESISERMTVQASFQRDCGWPNNEKLFMLARFQIRCVTSIVVLRFAE